MKKNLLLILNFLIIGCFAHATEQAAHKPYKTIHIDQHCTAHVEVTDSNQPAISIHLVSTNNETIGTLNGWYIDKTMFGLPKVRTADLKLLKLNPAFHKNYYGTLLYWLFLKEIYAINPLCSKSYVWAEPLDVEDIEQVLPGLIMFYKSLGFRVTKQYRTYAEMEHTFDTDTVQRLETKVRKHFTLPLTSKL